MSKGILPKKPGRPQSEQIFPSSKLRRLESLSKDPLPLFSVLYSFAIANYLAFNGDALRGLPTQFLAIAQMQGATVPLIIIKRELMRTSVDSTSHGAAFGKTKAAAETTGKVVRGWGQSLSRRNRAQVAAAGCGESARIFRACAGGSA
jgi:hypothetical protein